MRARLLLLGALLAIPSASAVGLHVLGEAPRVERVEAPAVEAPQPDAPRVGVLVGAHGTHASARVAGRSPAPAAAPQGVQAEGPALAARLVEDPVALALLVDGTRAERFLLHGRPREDPALAPAAAVPVTLVPESPPPAKGLPPASPAPWAAPLAAPPSSVPPPSRAGPSPVRLAAAQAASSEAAKPWMPAAGLALLLLLPFALYHRLRGARLLDQGTRGRLHALLKEGPGLTPTEAGRLLGCDATTAAYHLRRLVAERLAVAHGPARAVRYFAAGRQPPETRAPEHEAILAAVRASPGISQSGLARALAMPRASLAARLARLEGEGLVRIERAGRAARVLPAT